MGNLFAGFSLILLAVIVILAAVLHFSGLVGESDPRPLEADKNDVVDDPATVIVTVGKGRNVDPILPGPPTLPKNLGDDPGPGYLTPEERSSVDADGFLPHTIEPGETLSRIAEKYLGRSTLWHHLKVHNPEISDAGHIREGTQIKIPLWLREHR